MKLFILVDVLTILSICCQSCCLTAGQCEQLGFPPDSYQVGNNLTYCQTSSYQCCNQSYLSSAANTASDKLQEGLRQQLDEVKKRFSATVNLTAEYFNTIFVHQWIASGKIPNPRNLFNVEQLSEVYSPFNRTFISNVTNLLNNITFSSNIINLLNTTKVVDDIITSLKNTASNRLANNNETVKNCTRDQIAASVNINGLSRIASRLNELGNGLITLAKFELFLRGLAITTSFTFPRNCTKDFVQLNFCRRCTVEIPPVCSNTCGALIQGCYSPYYTALSEELDILLNVSSQVVTSMNATLGTLFTEEANVFNSSSLSQLQQRCGVEVPASNVTPTTNTVKMISGDRINELKNQMGGFYDNEGVPSLCKPVMTEHFFCTNLSSNSVRVNNCSLHTACTSECKCFNGQTEQITNTDKFRGYAIRDQVTNPVLNLSTSELESIAVSIGSPVSEFLTRPDINGTFPSGVVIPPKPVPPNPTTTDNGDSTTDDDDDGGSVTFNYKRNFILLIGMTFIAILFIY